MKTIARAALVVLLASCVSVSAQAPKDPYPTMAPISKYLMPSAADEVALARTAAPPSISAHAEVLVLTAKGYVIAAKGMNGWVCWVERSWTAGLDDQPEFWDWKNRSPNCFNPPAVKSVLPQYLARTRWAIGGDTREEIAAKSKAAYADHRFTDPAPGSLSLMMSKEGYLGDRAGGPWRPHVMPFVTLGDMTPKRRRLPVETMAGDLQRAGDAAHPTEFHPERAIGRDESRAARLEDHSSVTPQPEGADGQQRVTVAAILPLL